MGTVTFELRDIDAEMVQAWRKYFMGISDVRISQGEIFDSSADAIISPANSFGYMDGGIDLVYLHRFGWELQTRLQTQIKADYDGELPVGQATIVETFDEKIPYLVSAPTMRVPTSVANTVNAYLAFRAAIRAIKQHNREQPETIRTVLCPGLCTAIGRMPTDLAAKQMAAAFEVCILNQTVSPSGHWYLLGH
ncbi:macro domain-containing protein [Bradyrhizobium sp.]|uniref:macro domain-containing protein n=1 Tax=Bradyrhizobium sp. TaxID=376 RepID=UPI00260F1845|nr:macro domain-containing protein [Bradyrhizobium sp.]